MGSLHASNATSSADGGSPRRSRVPRWALGAGLALAVAVRAAWRLAQLVRGAPAQRLALAHAAVLPAPGERPLRLLVLGDSAADGYGLADPAVAYPHQVAVRLAALTGRPVAVDSKAVDGARTRDVLVRQVPAVAGSAPDLVVVAVGVNEALRGASARRVEMDTRVLLDALASCAGPGGAPAVRVVLAPCPDLGGAPGLPWPASTLVGWRCRVVRRAQQRAGAAAGVPVVRFDVRPPAAMFGTDGLHPGTLGAAASAALLARTLTTHQEARTWISDWTDGTSSSPAAPRVSASRSPGRSSPRAAG
jgi:lysophospholipase L1-like esterase